MVRKFLSSSLQMAMVPVLTLLIAGLTQAASTLPASAQARAVQPEPRVLGAVDPAVSTTLKGNTLPFANARNDRGRVPDTTPTGRLLLQLRPSAEQRTALDTLVAAQQDPKSASFHKWLTVTDYAKQFGVADADIQAVTGYLSQQGFNVARVLPNKTAIEFSGTAGQVRTAFKTEIHTFAAHGQTFMANDRDPQVPTALAAVVAGIPSLNSYRPPAKTTPFAESVASKTASGPGRGKVHALYTDATNFLVSVSPGDIATIYDIPSSATGAGVTMGFVGTSTVNLTYYQNYRNTFGLGSYTPAVIIDGSDPGVGNNLYLDLFQMELASAVAPAAKINYYTSASTDLSSGLNFALIRAVTDDAVQVLVLSQENCEANLGLAANQFLNDTAEFGSALGITVIAKSGNGGSAECDSGGGDGLGTEPSATKGLAVSGYASSPYVTAVGATDFFYPAGDRNETYLLQCCWSVNNGGAAGYTSADGYITEQPWNDSNDVNNGAPFPVLVASGGGVSTLGGVSADGTTSVPYPEPSWQLPVVPASISSTARVVPDVSMFGADAQNGSIYMACVQADECVNSTPDKIVYGFGAGTEAAAAVFGGVAALVDQAHGPQGNINPTLYSMYATAPSAFHDVTNGTNTVACTAGSPNCGSDGFISTGSGQAYVAAAGYDAASGLGSVDVANLINKWSPPNSTASTTTFTLTSAGSSTPITSFVHGTTVQANISVTGGSGTPTGDVSLIAGTSAPASAGVNFATLTNGSAVLTQGVSGLAGGTYPITARYAGDGTYAGSLSAPVTVTVSPETSKLEVESQSFSSGASLSYGTPITVKIYAFSATNPNSIGTPTGSVTVTDVSGQTLPVIPLDSQGFATFTATLPAGAHSLSFSYGGDVSYQSSSLSTSLNFTVNAQPTTTTLTSSNTNDGSGDYVQLVALVGTSVTPSGTATWPTGTISFQTVGNNAKTLGTSTLVPGTNASGQAIGIANFQMVGSSLPNNPTLVTAIYKPASTSNYAASISQNLSITKKTTAGLSTSTVGITTDDGKGSYFNYDGSIKFDLTISGGGAQPTGTVSLYDNGVLLASQDGTASPGTLTLNSKPATYTINADPNTGILPLTIGRNIITAQYNGDSTHATSTRELSIIILSETALPDFSLQASNVFGIINPSSTTTAFTLQLTSINNFAALGQKVTFTAAAPTGIACTFGSKTVTFGATASYASDTVTCGPANGYTVASLAPEQRPLGRFWLASGGATLACVFLLGIPARRKSWRNMAGAGFILLLTLCLTVGGLAGCSSNALGANAAQASLTNDAKAGVKPFANKTLAKGTYQVLITATGPFATNVQSNAATVQTHTLPLQIVVQ